MSIRLHLLAAVVIGFVANDALAQATSVTLQLFPFTGEVRLLNENITPFSFVIYRLDSPSGALNGSNGVWKSIADTYDASGNGFIDPTHEWVELTPNAGANATNLSESVIPGPGGALAAERSLSLGNIWDPNKVSDPDVTAQIGLPNGSNATVIVRTALNGDYLRDRKVNVTDYDIWKLVFGWTSGGLSADGNIDGKVDAADYTVWRDNLGLRLPASGDGELGAGGAALAASAVPEPASVWLAFAVGSGWLLRRARRRG